ncbi:hypothetical protein Tco_0393425 [Tanacetum coccineum]
MVRLVKHGLEKFGFEDCRKAMREIDDELVKEEEKSWDGGLSKTLMLKKGDLWEMKMVIEVSQSGECQLKAKDREVNDTEKEANSKESVPSWITLDEEETFWEGEEDELE